MRTENPCAEGSGFAICVFLVLCCDGSAGIHLGGLLINVWRLILTLFRVRVEDVLVVLCCHGAFSFGGAGYLFLSACDR